MITLFHEFLFAISAVAIFKIYSSEKLFVSTGTSASMANGRDGGGAEGEGERLVYVSIAMSREIALRNRPLFAWKFCRVSANESPFDMIRNIIQCASSSAFDCAPIAQLLMVTTRQDTSLPRPVYYKTRPHACTRTHGYRTGASASTNRRSESTDTVAMIKCDCQNFMTFISK